MGVKFKFHETPGGHTVDLSLRISAIANGWVIKAGDVPFFVFTEGELKDAIEDILTQFVDQTCTRPKEP